MSDAGTTGRSTHVQLILGAVSILAAIVLVVMGAMNRSLQTDIAAGQAKLATVQASANVNNTLIRLLAKSAAETGDPQIRALLARNGITYQSAPTAGAPTPAPVN